jgi:hypothetical protein
MVTDGDIVDVRAWQRRRLGGFQKIFLFGLTRRDPIRELLFPDDAILREVT